MDLAGIRVRSGECVWFLPRLCQTWRATSMQLSTTRHVRVLALILLSPGRKRAKRDAHSLHMSAAMIFRGITQDCTYILLLPARLTVAQLLLKRVSIVEHHHHGQNVYQGFEREDRGPWRLSENAANVDYGSRTATVYQRYCRERLLWAERQAHTMVGGS